MLKMTPHSNNEAHSQYRHTSVISVLNTPSCFQTHVTTDTVDSNFLVRVAFSVTMNAVWRFGNGVATLTIVMSHVVND
jgi:hypothetical protein